MSRWLPPQPQAPSPSPASARPTLQRKSKPAARSEITSTSRVLPRWLSPGTQEPTGPAGSPSAPLGPDQIHQIAAAGVQGNGSPLPHLEELQSAFHPHDLSNVRAFIGGPAQAAADALNAMAYTVGNRIAFATPPSLQLAAHEATHVIQQRDGVHLVGGVGQYGDRFELQADEAASRVRGGNSGEAPFLDGLVGFGAAGTANVQFMGKSSVAELVPAQHAMTPMSPEEAEFELANLDFGRPEALLELAQAIDQVRLPAASGARCILRLSGNEYPLNDWQIHEFRNTARALFIDAARRARTIIDGAIISYEAQQDIDREHYIISSIVRTPIIELLDPGTKLPDFKNTVYDRTRIATESIDSLSESAKALIDAETAARQAHAMVRAYKDKIIASAESCVSQLEIVKETAFLLLAALAIITTGGTAAAIATGAPIVATLGQTTVSFALGIKVDWGRITVDLIGNIILGKFGSWLSKYITKWVITNGVLRWIDAKKVKILVSYIFETEMSQALSASFMSVVTDVYDMLFGKDVSGGDFLTHVAERLLDPKEAFKALFLGALEGAAKSHHEAGKHSDPHKMTVDERVPTNKSPTETTIESYDPSLIVFDEHSPASLELDQQRSQNTKTGTPDVWEFEPNPKTKKGMKKSQSAFDLSEVPVGSPGTGKHGGETTRGAGGVGYHEFTAAEVALGMRTARDFLGKITSSTWNVLADKSLPRDTRIGNRIGNGKKYRITNSDNLDSIRAVSVKANKDLAGTSYDQGHIAGFFLNAGDADVADSLMLNENIVPMHRSVNRAGGDYFRAENAIRQIRKTVRPSDIVTVVVDIQYGGRAIIGRHSGNSIPLPDLFTVQVFVNNVLCVYNGQPSIFQIINP